MPAPASNVAAHWDRASDCVECSGTLNVVYQQQNGQLQWGNLSLSGWDWQDLPANPIIGSGLAIDMRVTRNARDMLLYYQLEDGGMTSLTFNNSSESISTFSQSPWVSLIASTRLYVGYTRTLPYRSNPNESSNSIFNIR